MRASQAALTVVHKEREPRPGACLLRRRQVDIVAVHVLSPIVASLMCCVSCCHLEQLSRPGTSHKFCVCHASSRLSAHSCLPPANLPFLHPRTRLPSPQRFWLFREQQQTIIYQQTISEQQQAIAEQQLRGQAQDGSGIFFGEQSWSSGLQEGSQHGAQRPGDRHLRWRVLLGRGARLPARARCLHCLHVCQFLLFLTFSAGWPELTSLLSSACQVPALHTLPALSCTALA